MFEVLFWDSKTLLKKVWKFVADIFFRIMEGEGSLLRYSPELHLKNMSKQNAGSLLPPIYLLHGTDDHSIPHVARYMKHHE